MPIRTGRFLCVGLLLGVTEGCAVTATGTRESASPEQVQLTPSLEPRMDLDPNWVIEQARMGPGAHCLIDSTTKEVPSSGSGLNERSFVGGRIVSIDERQIVLDQVISISETPSAVTGVPAGRKGIGYQLLGPLSPRLFKRSGTGHKSIPIDGEVVVDRSAIRMIYPESGANWDPLRQRGQWFMRPGMTFDVPIAKLEAGYPAAPAVNPPDTVNDVRELPVSPTPSAKVYDPGTQKIEDSSLTKDLKQRAMQQPYASVEILNGTSR